MNPPLSRMPFGKDRDRGEAGLGTGLAQGHLHAEAGFLGCSPWLLRAGAEGLKQKQNEWFI